MSAPKVVVVAGPTATGKTRLGILLAQALGGEIVSADSMQVYRRMDVGTAKATAEERAAAPHHMLDVAEPRENYSVSRYVAAASRCCDDILARGKLPIVVGGTGLYIDSLLSGRDFAACEEDGARLREALNARWDAEGGEALLEELAAFDPARAAKLHPGDRRRIVRAIEIYRLTGETISAHDARTRALPPRYEAARIHLNFRSRAASLRMLCENLHPSVRDGGMCIHDAPGYLDQFADMPAQQNAMKPHLERHIQRPSDIIRALDCPVQVVIILLFHKRETVITR